MARKVPQRMCVACRMMQAKRDLIRLVVDQAGRVELDPSGKKPGRGAYVCKNRGCLSKAIKEQHLARGLKKPVDKEIISQLTAEMEALPDVATID